MAASRNKTTDQRKKIKPANAGTISVSGDSSVKKLKLSKSKKKSVTVRTVEKTLSAPPILVAVEVDSGPAKIARYSGLFFMLVGACFASYSISGLYVEVVELSVSNHTATLQRLLPAQIVSVPPTYGVPDEVTETVVTPPEDVVTEIPPVAEPQQEINTVSTTSHRSQNMPLEEEIISKQLMQPPITVLLSGRMPLSGSERVHVTVLHAESVELVLIPHTTLVEWYLGRTRRESSDSWSFVFDTTAVPNGDYELFARVKNSYGTYRSSALKIRTYNPVTARTNEPVVDPTIADAVDSVTSEFAIEEPHKSIQTELSTLIAPARPTQATVHTVVATDSASTTAPQHDTLPVDPTIDATARDFLSQIDTDLTMLIERYGVALRSGDTKSKELVLKRISDLERAINDRVFTDLLSPSSENADSIAQQVRDRLSVLITDSVNRREREERLIQERTGNSIVRDSDRDGISDYDELRIYNTDPYTADSDADGFTDGAEVLSGYDPTNSEREAAVRFEDPRETGTDRSDILSVSSLEVLSPESAPEDSSTATDSPSIRFSGVALPNSFVTLYIYSTPVIVTVKTKDDGSFVYTFDKELDDGQHEVYVGITDNAGKLVAKSKPFAFVKTANAYTVGRIPTEPVPVPVESPRLMTGNVLVLTVSLVVILMGLVLVLIGAYLARRVRPALTVAAPIVTT